MNKALKTSVKEAKSYTQLLEALSQLELQDLTSSSVHLIDKGIKRLYSGSSLKIAYLGNYTLEPLPSYVNVVSALNNIIIDDYIGNYDQYFQEVLDSGSALIEYSPQIIYLALSLRKLAPRIYYQFSDLGVKERKQQLEQIVSSLSDWIAIALKNTQATILIGNFMQPCARNSGISDFSQSYSETEFYSELNLTLLRTIKNESRVHLFDIEQLASRFGKEQAQDTKMYYMAKIEWRENFLTTIAEEFVRYIKAIKGYTKKCLVLDMDNTLWGGVIGEEGAMGVKVGQGDPISEAFLEFQYKIKAIKNRGIILAVCSKNNMDDALEVFEKRPEMPLKKSDFSAMAINWNPKHKNLQQIASELNIGTDSLVFIDDNPAECSLVTQMMPEVKTIQLPSDPATYPKLLDQLNEFEKVQILQDDLAKAVQYTQNEERKKFQQQTGDMESYLESLGTEIKLWEALEENLPRVHQLFSKTNQFNLTTIRHSMAEVEEFCQSDSYDLTVISARDRFGEIGIIAIYLIDLNREPLLDINSLIMSCRAMGRGIETAIINHLKTKYLINKRGIQMISTYIPTQKNKPVLDLFEKQGFKLASKDKEGTKKYTLKSESAELINSSWIKIVE